jgi:hypothetical protein
MRYFLFLMAALSWLSGCASKQDVGGGATVAALIVAVPLLPFAEVYHVINDTQGKAKDQLVQWREHFDPVYQKRIDIIMSQNPITDAELRFNQQNIVFFPTERGSDTYIGLLWAQYDIDGAKNQQMIDNDPFLTHMQVLLVNDPTHEKVASYKYHSAIHDCFVEKAFNYKAAFNIRMSELSNLYAPNNLIKKSATKCLGQQFEQS